MRRPLSVIALCLICASPAFASDMPSRKAGLWEMKMSFNNNPMPTQTMRQCIDASTDKLMKSNFGGAPQGSCSKHEISRSGESIIVDSVCSFAGATTTSHAVITGDFNSDYTMKMTSKSEGGPPIPGMRHGGVRHMTITAKWMGPCPASDRPGDIIMGNGFKINVRDMGRMNHMGGMPNLPHMPWQ